MIEWILIISLGSTFQMMGGFQSEDACLEVRKSIEQLDHGYRVGCISKQRNHFYPVMPITPTHESSNI